MTFFKARAWALENPAKPMQARIRRTLRRSRRLDCRITTMEHCEVSPLTQKALPGAFGFFGCPGAGPDSRRISSTYVTDIRASLPWLAVFFNLVRELLMTGRPSTVLWLYADSPGGS